MTTQGYEHLPFPERSTEWIRRFWTEVGWSSAQEPERSRRILRLLIANRLTHPGDTPGRPAPFAVRVPLIYAVTPANRAAARTLAPEELLSWYAKSDLAKIDPEAFNGTFEKSLADERAAQHHLLDVLRAHLARREYHNAAKVP